MPLSTHFWSRRIAMAWLAIVVATTTLSAPPASAQAADKPLRYEGTVRGPEFQGTVTVTLRTDHRRIKKLVAQISCLETGQTNTIIYRNVKVTRGGAYYSDKGTYSERVEGEVYSKRRINGHLTTNACLGSYEYRGNFTAKRR